MTAVEPYRPAGMATAADWAQFLKPLLAALNKQPTREEYIARCAAIAYAVPDVPASMLVPWRQRDAMRTFRFLPSPAEVAEWIGPSIREERESMARSTRLAAPSDLPPSPATRTPEEAAAVRAKAAAFAAEMADNTVRQAPPARALTLSDGALLARYETLAAEGNRAAAVRADMLRKRMEMQP